MTNAQPVGGRGETYDCPAILNFGRFGIAIHSELCYNQNVGRKQDSNETTGDEQCTASTVRNSQKLLGL